MNNYINPPSCTLPALSGESQPGTFLMKWAERRSSYQNQNCCNRHPDDDFLVVHNLICELGEAAVKVVGLLLRTINRSPAVLIIQVRKIFPSIFLTKISSSPVISTALPFGNIKYSSNLGEKYFNRWRPSQYFFSTYIESFAMSWCVKNISSSSLSFLYLQQPLGLTRLGGSQSGWLTFCLQSSALRTPQHLI